MNSYQFKITNFLSVIPFLLLSSYGGFAQTPTQTIPDFTFYKLDETSFTKKDLAQGRKLLMVFFDSDCEHCQRTIAYFSQHYEELKKTPLYLISLDNKEKIDRFMAKYAQHLRAMKNVTILQDRQLQFISKFKPKKYPSMYLFSSDNKLIAYEDNDQSAPRILHLIKEPVK